MLQRLDRLYERASNNRQGIFLLLSAIAIYFDTLLADRRKKRNLFWNTTLLEHYTIENHPWALSGVLATAEYAGQGSGQENDSLTTGAE